MTSFNAARVLALSALLSLPAPLCLAQPIASGELEIRGMALEIVETSLSIEANIGTPSYVQTRFSGRTDDAPAVEGLTAEGDLVGPEIASPITLRTAPGHRFEIPGLASEGEYYLQNVRLVRDGQFVANAVPSVASIHVSNKLQTEVKVRQLTAQDLRDRGIVVDLRNFDVYEYTFVFYVDGKVVEIPYPVIVDARTHEVHQVVGEAPYNLPPVSNITPPRWTPPAMLTFGLDTPVGDQLPPPTTEPMDSPRPSRPSIPAALVLPGNLAVLHQFFAVGLNVANGAPTGSSVKLEGVSAAFRAPRQIRVAGTDPSVAAGQSVPIRPANGSVLQPQQQGSAEWTVEGLSAGTYTIDVDVRATMTQDGQPDLVLSGTKSAAVVIHDPRFNITFSHPSSVEAAVDWSSDASAYSAWAFVTNMSPSAQTVVLSTGLQTCSSVPQNLCLAGASSKSVTLELAQGQTKEIEYRLKSNQSGSLFASSTSSDGGAVAVGFQLLGGENFSPATLVMPWYARYLDQSFVNANLQLLGRGYGIATAPLTGTMAMYPRVIKTDVFMRAIDIARAGQRAFITESESDPAKTRAGKRFAFSNLALDLLGARDARRRNGESMEHRNALHEWDALRRLESENGKSGRSAGAALARQLEATFEPGDNAAQLFDRFAAANAHRSDFVAALVTRGNARITFASPAGTTRGANDSGDQPYSRRVPFADIHRLRLPDNTTAEQGLIGHWTTNVDLVISADGPFELELVYPGGDLGAPLRVSRQFSNVASHTYTLRLVNGVASIDGRDETGLPLTITNAAPLAVAALEVLAARQDLHLDSEGHKISLLFNRPVAPGDGDLFRKFKGEVVFVDGSYSFRGPRPISAAALQEDGRVVNLTFDHALHTNVSRRPGCSYTISAAGAMTDPISGASVSSVSIPATRVDNDRPAAIFYGRVLAGDGTPIEGADVILYAGPPQYDTSNADARTAALGAFFFEYVPRDPVNGYSGAFTLQAITKEEKTTSASGTIRTPGAVYPIDLQFLGRGSAEGYVRYDDTNAPVAGARVVVGSRMFSQFRSTTTNSAGFYRVTDVLVGPLTFSATDGEGNVVYATGELGSPGEVAVQNLLIHRQPFPGLGHVRGTVRRSDGANDPIAGAHVGVYSQGYGLFDGYTDTAGRFEFTGVPAGLVTVLTEEWTVAYQSASVDFDLRADEMRDVTLILPVRGQGVSFARVEGLVTREDAGSSEPRAVPGALVQIDGYPAATADAAGRYAYESVPLSFSARRVRAWDPESKRIGENFLPSLRTDITNSAPIHIRAATGGGKGTIRVLLLDAAGAAVSSGDYKVLQTGYPVVELDRGTETGVFTRANVPVGTTVELIAVPLDPNGRYGEQFVAGSARIDIDQQIVSRTLRLPGQGQILVSLSSSGTKQLGPVRLDYTAWDGDAQELGTNSKVLSTEDPPNSGLPGYARFPRVPAQQNVTVSADLAAQGSASQGLLLSWEGQVLQTDLRLGTRARVRGRVLHFDGLTPIAGAIVTIADGRQDPGPQTTGSDGSFEFADVPPGVNFRLTATWYDNGIYRTGFTNGKTPAYGGIVEGLVLTLRRQANLEGRIVFADRKADPNDPTKTVPDDTPGDYSDNAPIPRGAFWLSELEFPNRSFGSQGSPLRADLDGNFVVANLFEGPFRITASNLDQSASLGGRIALDSVNVSVILAVGAEGAGTIDVRVVNPNQGYVAVPNAEATLYRNGSAFDFGSTDAAGRIAFLNVPALGNYKVGVYSKALGLSGGSDLIPIVANESAIVEVVLLRSGSVSGSLTDAAASDAGVVGAHVDLQATGYSTRSTTGAGGAFVFDGVREGGFRLETRDPLSNRRASGQGEITQDDFARTVNLRLPRWASLRVNTWLPDDYGAQSTTPASSVAVEVKQLCYQNSGTGGLICEELRSAQGGTLQFDRVLSGTDYIADVEEIGGGGWKIALSGRLGEGETKQHDVVLPAYGRVAVRVINRDTRAPMENVRVQVSGDGAGFTGYTDATGSVLAGSFMLNREVWVGATTIDGRLSGKTRATILRSSVPAEATIELASYATVGGYVGAERGGPSIGTRVIAQSTIETLTDGAGRFSIAGFVTGSPINLVYFGPDGQTIGARLTFTPTVPGVNEVPPVRLDATPAAILAVAPSDGALDVPLDARVEIVFSEQIAPVSLSPSYFQLAPNGSSTNTPVVFSTLTDARGYAVTLIPQQALKSHTLYRLVISGSVADMNGHTLGSSRGLSFTTSDRSEPQILRVSPDPMKPAPVNSVFEVELNEALNAADWQTGGAGRMTLSKLSGEPPLPVGAVAGLVWLDEETKRILRFSPSDRLEVETRYRLEISGIRDLQGNVLAKQTIDFATTDATRPFVSIKAPSAAEPLVSGLLYTTQLDLLNTNESGLPTTELATDIDRVEYFQKVGGAWQLAQIVRKTAANPGCAYSFTAPANVASFALRAIAFDTSFNESQPADVTWTVVADEAPQNVNIVTSVGGAAATSAHAGSAVTATLTFDERGFVATYTIRAVGAKDGQTLFSSTPKSAQLQRQPGGVWPAVTYTVALPKTLPAGTVVTFSADVTDSKAQKGTGSAALVILQDAVAPRVTSVASPTPDQTFSEGAIVSLSLRASDAEVGVQEVRATLGTSSVVLTPVSGTDEFRGSIQTPDVSGSEPIAFDLGFVARDFAGNASATSTVRISVTPIFDPTAPVVTLVCGTSGAMLPLNESATIRVSAVPGTGAGADATNRISEVRFFLGDATEPFDTKAYDASNTYSTSVSSSGMAAGASLTVNAVARTFGGNSGNASTSIEVVAATNLTGLTIQSADPRYENTSIYVKGGTLTIDGKHTFADVIVLDGGVLTHSATSPSATQRMEISAQRTFVECGGGVDVSGRGYSGAQSGWAYTWPNTWDGGSNGGSSGSHGGRGYGSNAAQTFDSVVWPYFPGGAGGSSGSASGTGGGVVVISSSVIALDGSILANGSDPGSAAAGGAGGTIRLTAGAVRGSGSIRAAGAKGGGGGRVAIHSNSVIDFSRSRISAAGGEQAAYKGSAGTVYLREGTGDDEVETIVVDNDSIASPLVTDMPSLGAGAVTSVAWPVLVLSTPAARWIEGSRIEFFAAGGTSLGSWRVAERFEDGTIRLETSAPSGPIVAGHTFRGHWKLDTVIATRGGKLAFGNLRVSEINGTTDGLVRFAESDAAELTVRGNAHATGRVEATTLTIATGGRLEVQERITAVDMTIATGGTLAQTQTPVSGTTYPRIDLDISGTLDVTGVINATGAGFRGSAGYYGRTWPGVLQSAAGSGGSFGGRGQQANPSAGYVSGDTYGTVADPAEPGAAGAEATSPYGGPDCDAPACSAGGGVVRIKSGTLLLNGSIVSDGQSVPSQPSNPYDKRSGSGGGGSISIDAGTISGTGTIHANGGARNAPGGGGRIAVRADVVSLPADAMSAFAGGNGASSGTIVSYGAASTHGVLIVDNNNFTSSLFTELPAVGRGVAATSSSGSSLVTERASFPEYAVGRWVEIRDSNDVVKGVWRTIAINGGVLTLEPGASISAGDTWHGVYRFDSISIRNEGKLSSADPILAPGYNRPTGTLSLAAGQANEALAGTTIKVIVTATDAQSLQRITLRASGPVAAASAAQSRPVTGSSTTQAFDVVTLSTAQTGELVGVVADVVDEIGTIVSTRELAVAIIRDEIPPTISAVDISPTSADLRYPSATQLTIAVTAFDNVAVSSVSANIAGTVMTDTTAPYQFTWTAPKVVIDTPVEIVITARDPQGNASPVTRTVTIVPASGGAIPTVGWSWPTAVATVPAGHPIRLGVAATDDSGVLRIEFFEEGGEQPFHTVDAPNFSTTSLAAETTRVLPAQTGPRTFRVRVHDISPVYTESQISLESVAAVTINAASPDWTALQTSPGVLASGTLVMTQPRQIAGLYVLSGATVTHPLYASSYDNKAVNLDVAGDLWVERGARIGVSGAGFRSRMSYPLEAIPGGGSGGSHIGSGGLWNTPASSNFGSVYRPVEAGAGGGQTGSDGGGVVRLRADRVVVDGSIVADGTIFGTGGGAGGSIWITAREYGGHGEVAARGAGISSRGGGGGGAIMLDYDLVAGAGLPTVTAMGGASSLGLPGSAGSIVERVGTSLHGTLKVNNGGLVVTTALPALGSGSAASGTALSHLETGRSVAVPLYFVGHWIEVRTSGGDLRGRWRVKTVSGFGVDLEPNGTEQIDVQAGDSWQGVYVFSAVETSGGAGLVSSDPIRIDTSARE